MDSLIEQRGDFPRSVRKGKKQVLETASEQVEALIQQQEPQNCADAAKEESRGAGGKRHFVEESSSPPEGLVVEKPEKKHFVSKSCAPTLAPGSTGLGSALEVSEHHSTIAMVSHPTGQDGGVIAHDTLPSDLSGSTKPTKRVFQGLSGGVETVEAIKPPPKRSKTRRETTAAAFIVPPKEEQQQEVETSKIRVIEGARNKQDHLKKGAIPEPERTTTRRHFLKDNNQQDHVTQILNGSSENVVQPKMKKVPVVANDDGDHRAAGRASVDINVASSSGKGTAAASKVAAMAGTAMQGCLSWGE